MKPAIPESRPNLFRWPELFPCRKSSLLHCLSLFWLCFEAYGILVPQSGTEPQPLAVKALSPNHWTTKELPSLLSVLAKVKMIVLLALLSNLKCSLAASSSLCLIYISLALIQVSFFLSIQHQQRLISPYVLYSMFLDTLCCCCCC